MRKMTITITNERQYIENGNACIYIDEYDETYNYSSLRTWKSFKTLKGLNNHIAKVAMMANREAVTVIA